MPNVQPSIADLEERIELLEDALVPLAEAAKYFIDRKPKMILWGCCDNQVRIVSGDAHRAADLIGMSKSPDGRPACRKRSKQ